MTTPCRAYESQLSSYVDDALEPAARAALESHLNDCALCRGEVDGLRRMVQALRTMHAPAAPNLVPRVRATLEQSATASHTSFNWWPVHGLALVAGSVLLIVVMRTPDPADGKPKRIIVTASVPRPAPPAADARMVVASRAREEEAAPAPAVASFGKAMSDETSAQSLSGVAAAPIAAAPLSLDDAIELEAHGHFGAAQINRVYDAAPPVRMTSMHAGALLTAPEQKLRVPEGATHVEWRVTDTAATIRQLREWLPTVKGAVLAQDENHLLIHLPYSLYPQFLEQLHRFSAPDQTMPALEREANPSSAPITIDLLLHHTP